MDQEEVRELLNDWPYPPRCTVEYWNRLHDYNHDNRDLHTKPTETDMIWTLENFFPDPINCSCELIRGKRCVFHGDDEPREEFDALGNRRIPVGHDYCQNRNLFVECNANCPDGCCNKPFITNAFKNNLALVHRHGRGWGLVTMEPIKKGDFIQSFAGEVYHKKSFPKNSIYACDMKVDSGVPLSKRLVIDPTRRGNMGRFIGHSHNPNADMITISTGGALRNVLVANKNIGPGTEIFFDYGDEYELENCLCEDSSCPDIKFVLEFLRESFRAMLINQLYRPGFEMPNGNFKGVLTLKGDRVTKEQKRTIKAIVSAILPATRIPTVPATRLPGVRHWLPAILGQPRFTFPQQIPRIQSHLPRPVAPALLPPPPKVVQRPPSSAPQPAQAGTSKTLYADYYREKRKRDVDFSQGRYRPNDSSSDEGRTPPSKAPCPPDRTRIPTAPPKKVMLPQPKGKPMNKPANVPAPNLERCVPLPTLPPATVTAPPKPRIIKKGPCGAQAILPPQQIDPCDPPQPPSRPQTRQRTAAGNDDDPCTRRDPSANHDVDPNEPVVKRGRGRPKKPKPPQQDPPPPKKKTGPKGVSEAERTCKKCSKPKVFPDKHKYDTHMQEVHGDKKFPCPYRKCKESFTSQRLLDQHMPHHEDRDERVQWGCHDCWNKYLSKGGLRYHQQHTKCGRMPPVYIDPDQPDPRYWLMGLARPQVENDAEDSSEESETESDED